MKFYRNERVLPDISKNIVVPLKKKKKKPINDKRTIRIPTTRRIPQVWEATRYG